MPELRKDPVTGRWVIISTDRQKRPNDFRFERAASIGREHCPFCPGHESFTPREVFAYRQNGTAPNTPGWDIRVVPTYRRRGVGAALFEAAEAWALEKDCRWLKVETQNINMAACRFYERCGCVLRSVRGGAYPECPDEVELLWYKALVQPQVARV